MRSRTASLLALLAAAVAAASCGDGSRTPLSPSNTSAPQAMLMPSDGGCDATMPASTGVDLGGTTRFFAGVPFTIKETVYNACGSIMSSPPNPSWRISSGAASLSPSGTRVTVTPSAAGTLQIVFSSRRADGQGIEDYITLTIENQAPSRIAVTPTSMALPPGEQQSFTVGVYNSSGTELAEPTVTVSSSNPGVAAVSMTDGRHGVVSGVAIGTATVTVTSGSLSTTMSVRVGQPRGIPVSISLSPTRATIKKGQYAWLTATVLDDYGTQVYPTLSWTSSNPYAASVDGSGSVYGVENGTSTVRVCTPESLCASAVIEVQNTFTASIVGPNPVVPWQSATYYASTSCMDCVEPFRYEWSVNSIAIPGQTGPTLTIVPQDYSNGGSYYQISLMVRDAVGRITSTGLSVSTSSGY